MSKVRVTKRQEAIARLLCKQWDDEWSLGKKWHLHCAKEIIKLSDSFRRKL